MLDAAIMVQMRCAGQSHAGRSSLSRHPPSKTSDLTHLLRRGPVTCPLGVGCPRTGDLAHEVLVLQDVQGLLLPFSVCGTDYHKIGTRTTRNLERHVIVDHLFHHRFQMVSETAYADGVHNAHPVVRKFRGSMENAFLSRNLDDRSDPAPFRSYRTRAARSRITSLLRSMWNMPRTIISSPVT